MEYEEKAEKEEEEAGEREQRPVQTKSGKSMGVGSVIQKMDTNKHKEE